ncbi:MULTISPECIES: hypothetical protein [unclassified Coleofasciculus]|nr:MULTISPECIES: hypothetical protein [unclassified Coleofasciculus]MBD1880149.1 hypothetical protein [Coleofasciculus sp. FACHB-T130]MBD1894100.1 hypothetical protein [Coleofasciculus sp. FACHB-129]MBD2537722.1 hypothetical protein [Coleofasciculus sp. FACHB-SPT36]
MQPNFRLINGQERCLRRWELRDRTESQMPVNEISSKFPDEVGKGSSQ